MDPHVCVVCVQTARGGGVRPTHGTRTAVIRVRVLSELVTWQSCGMNSGTQKSSTFFFCCFFFNFFFFLPRQQAESRLIGEHGAENTNGSCPPWDRGLLLTTMIIDSSFHLLMLSEAKKDLFLSRFNSGPALRHLQCSRSGNDKFVYFLVLCSFSPLEVADAWHLRNNPNFFRKGLLKGNTIEANSSFSPKHGCLAGLTAVEYGV